MVGIGRFWSSLIQFGRLWFLTDFLRHDIVRIGTKLEMRWSEMLHLFYFRESDSDK